MECGFVRVLGSKLRIKSEEANRSRSGLDIARQVVPVTVKVPASPCAVSKLALIKVVEDESFRGL